MAPRRDLLPRTAPAAEVLRAVLDAVDRGLGVVVASVIARHGSAPSTPGQKLALFEGGDALGTIGGGAVEHAVLAAMEKALLDPASTPKVETFRLGASLGMCCGGSVEVLIEPLTPAIRALVVGGGHVGAFTAPLLASLGFAVTLVDGRERVADPERFGRGSAMRVVHADHDDPEVLTHFTKRIEDAICVVMTHDHQLDQQVIEWAIKQGFGFVGGVGSRAKAVRTRQRLEAKGVPTADIDRVRMPVGLDIGARSPAEIGVAIAGELVTWRNALVKKRLAQPENVVTIENESAEPVEKASTSERPS